MSGQGGTSNSASGGGAPAGGLAARERLREAALRYAETVKASTKWWTFLGFEAACDWAIAEDELTQAARAFAESNPRLPGGGK